jgi:DNA invertase Pin-like site-specific DNA recombinase
VRLADYYDLYLSNEKLQLNNTSNEDLERESVRNNCKFVTLGILAYFIKRERKFIKDRQSKELFEDNLRGTLIQAYLGDDFEELLFDLFTRINHQLAISYSKNQTRLGLTSHSNYFKSDSYYRDNILADIEQYFYLDKFAADYTDKLFKIFDK